MIERRVNHSSMIIKVGVDYFFNFQRKLSFFDVNEYAGSLILKLRKSTVVILECIFEKV